MRSTVRNLATFAALVAVTMCFMHVAIREPVAWVFVAVFTVVTVLCGTLTVQQELDTMKLPKIAALDLRQGTELDWFLARRKAHRTGAFEPLPTFTALG